MKFTFSLCHKRKDAPLTKAPTRVGLKDWPALRLLAEDPELFPNSLEGKLSEKNIRDIATFLEEDFIDDKVLDFFEFLKIQIPAHLILRSPKFIELFERDNHLLIHVPEDQQERWRDCVQEVWKFKKGASLRFLHREWEINHQKILELLSEVHLEEA